MDRNDWGISLLSIRVEVLVGPVPFCVCAVGFFSSVKVFLSSLVLEFDPALITYINYDSAM